MRIACQVLHCRHTRGDRKGDPLKPGDEWLCGEHWHLIPPAYRRAYGRRAKQWRRFYNPRDGAPTYRLWRRLVRCAIERAHGL
jgi:hypothetical protein